MPVLHYHYDAAPMSRPVFSYLPYHGMRRVAEGDNDRRTVGAIRRELSETVPGFAAVDAMVSTIDRRDRHTRLHSEDTMRHALRIGHEMGLSLEELRALTIAALLHDVGKIALPDSILCSPQPLTPEQFEAVKAHPVVSANLMNTLRRAAPGPVTEIELAWQAVRHHHESWDGAGYPVGLSGERIPLLARILAVADSFSAMTLDRSYREALPLPEAVSRLRAGAGRQWDPACVPALLRTLRVHETG